jgi:4-hydroxy-2-oxoheptanedioate aldolase
MIGYAGYDFVILDMEHVGVNPQTLENLIRAAECSGVTPLVRVPAVHPDTILRVLDAGAMGIVVPRVQNGEQAAQAVRASRYHPQGERGISGGRTTGFGSLDLQAYMTLANCEIMVVAMIEDSAGVENIDAIVAVPGIDMILEGAIDLSQSLGVPAQAQHPDVQAAIRRVATACAAYGVPFCAIPRADGQHEAWCKAGVRAFLLGDDRGVSFRALKAQLNNFCVPTSKSLLVKS